MQGAVFCCHAYDKNVQRTFFSRFMKKKSGKVPVIYAVAATPAATRADVTATV
ncbi:hypothetical protein BRYFOR_06108 [Marvinbryantia formatexigens DSM 14469]|uniref:Uncharacterized protein n=1 Tax=Marvinbryantia formatexigens DSM 14469 TaxID=478749 RepID=C6LBW3_9FIRM|nr:hypothetical protein BRYFOR_06108 [Marvinbryantia formatexigens DSM 14469]